MSLMDLSVDWIRLTSELEDTPTVPSNIKKQKNKDWEKKNIISKD